MFKAVLGLVLLHTAVAWRSDVHLTKTGDPKSMSVSWTTLQDSPDNIPPVRTSTVRYGLTKDSLTDKVTSPTASMRTLTEDLSTYDYCGNVWETREMNSVTLTDLPSDNDVYYTVEPVGAPGSDDVSPVYMFHTMPEVPPSEIHFLATADMGDQDTHDWASINEMVRESEQCNNPNSTTIPITLGLMIGDISYNLDLPPSGDNFMANMAPMTQNYPWQYGPGNHEADCNYTYANYRGRFAAQNLTAAKHGENSGSSRWYSFDHGPMHAIIIDTDAWGFDEVAYILEDQYNWLVQDLEAVDRDVTPFIVLLGHRPMYCSSVTGQQGSHLGYPKQMDGWEGKISEPLNYGEGFRNLGLKPPDFEQRRTLQHDDNDDDLACGVSDLIRNGMISEVDGSRKYGIEPLMEKYEIDVYLTGHEHNYERTYPVLNGEFTKSYDSPKKPVHVVIGSGGAYGTDEFGSAGPWDAFRSTEWSYTDIVMNMTHFHLTQKLATNSTIIDEFVLRK